MIWIIFSAVFNTIASILLKISSLPRQVALSGYLPIFLALIAYGAAFTFYKQSLIYWDLGVAYPAITALTALMLWIAGVFFFGETFNLTKILGLALILFGILLLTFSRV